MTLRRISADEFARRLRAGKDEKDRRYAFFLGAGCSVSSGIPAAGSLVLHNWLPRLKAICAPHEPDLLRWASREIPDFDPSNPSASYGVVIERLFLNPVERQREIENLCDRKLPGFGYATLAKLISMENGQFNVVLTTNFDNMIEDALQWFTDSRALTINHSSLVDFIRPTRTRPQLVKLHGDHLLEPYNTARETEALKKAVEKNVRTLLHDRGLIFLGYGGNDAGIASMLNGLPDNAVPFGVYWVNRAEPGGVLRTWLNKRNAVRVDITDFDEFMLIVHKAFDFERPTPDRFIRVFEENDRTYQRLSARIVSLSTPDVLVSVEDDAPLAAAGSSGFRQADDAQIEGLARAAGNELKVDEAAIILVNNPRVLPQPEIVRDLADRWIDYTLLATAYAEDTTLAMVDLEKLTKSEREEKVITRLLKMVVHVDTDYTDAQLEQEWQRIGPGVEVRARHILLKLPADASPVQRDKVKQLAEDIRQQAVNGASFAELARRYSEDPSNVQGGDLGYFGRGRMVPEFEDASFKLQDGQISPVVETAFGLHVIKVEDRRQREMENDVKEKFREFLLQRSRAAATQQFVNALLNASHVKVESDAPQQVREMATNFLAALCVSTGDRTLATFHGGKLTTGELQEEMANVSSESLKQFSEASDSSINEIVQRQIGKKLLLDEARKRGIQSTLQEIYDAREQARQSIMRLIQDSGIAQLCAPEASADNPASAQQIRELLQQAVMGKRKMPPLGLFGTELRRIYGFSFNQVAVQKVVERITQIRAAEQRTLDEIRQIHATHPY